ncbi:MAG TPA: TlpA disulfide reductase family protein [Candidatus Acidoferrum sp.]|nr:TlpA disulfide reductase family protein [Candidatus Acidoferrum sp.]
MVRMALVLAASMFLTSCSKKLATPIQEGATAPAFNLENIAGEHVALKDLQSKGLVLVNFWATWCSLCKAEVPILNKVHQDFGNKGLSVVGVAVEDRKDMVTTYRKRHEMAYPVLLDTSGDVSKEYGLFALPMTVLIDRKGTVVLRKYGVVDEQTLAALQAKLSAN